MGERVLFVPTWLAGTPQVIESLPAARVALDDLRSHYEVETFRWPNAKGGPAAPATWQGVVATLQDSMPAGSHVVAMGAATSVCLMALHGEMTGVRSFIAAGMSTPPATLREAGLNSIAAGAEAMFRWTSTYQYVRLIMQGASEEVWTKAADGLDRELDWPRTAAVQSSMESLNLIRESPSISCPTLYLDSPLNVAGFAEMREVFMRLVPHASVEGLDNWPARLQDQDTGRDLSARVIAFIEKVTKQGDG